MSVRRIALALAAAALVAAGSALAPRTALAYGVATHAWLAEEEALRLAAADPSLSFLATDPSARACFQYGAIFPDMRSTARQAAGLEQFRAKILGSGFVASVEFSTAEVERAFRYFKTHDSAFCLFLIDRARASGDRYALAFALGNLAHVLMDKHAQTMHIPSHVQRLHSGDLGVACVADPTYAPSWYPGDENEVLFEGFGDVARPRDAVAFVRDAPWRLDANRTVSYNRALALRRSYWEAAAAHMTPSGLPIPTETSIMNSARVFEATLTLYGFFTAQETLGDGMRLFAERYIRLEWWAQALQGVVQAITTNVFAGQDAFDLVGPFILPIIASQVSGRSGSVPGELIFAYGQGGAEIQKLRARYAGNSELARAEASGLLDRATYLATSYEGAHVLVLDGILRGAASRFTDDDRWPTYSKRVMRTAALRSLLRASGRDGIAEAPALLCWDLRLVDPASGAAVSEVALPADVGRTLRVEAEVLGVEPDVRAPRILRLRLRADTGAGAADPVVASVSKIIPGRALDLRSYGTEDRPIVALDWTVADVPGAVGLYVEVDERRPSLARDDGAADALLSTDLRPLAPLMQGRPHYDLHYATYGGEMSSIRVRR